MRVSAENDGFKVSIEAKLTLKNGPKDNDRVISTEERKCLRAELLRGMARTLEELSYSDFGIESIKLKK